MEGGKIALLSARVLTALFASVISELRLQFLVWKKLVASNNAFSSGGILHFLKLTVNPMPTQQSGICDSTPVFVIKFRRV